MRERFLLVWCAAAIAAGIAAGAWLVLPFTVLAALVFLLTAAAAWAVWTGRRKTAWALCLLLAFAAGWARMGIAEESWRNASHTLEGAEGTWYAVTSGEALLVKGVDPYIRYPVMAEEICYPEGVRRQVRGKIFLYVPWDGKSLPLPPDTAVKAEGKLSPFRFYRNPGKLDLESRYQSERLIGRIYVENAGAVTAEGSAGVFPASAAAWRIKEWIRRHFAPFLDPARLPLLMTLLFGGNYQDLPERALDDFTRIGIVHILSVSGSHIALLFSFLCLAGRWLRLPDRVVFPAAAVLMLCYAGMSGFAAPVVRASLMGIFSVMGMFFHRGKEGLILLSGAAAAMLFWEPLYLFDVSFQLSAGASAGILLFYGPLRRRILQIPLFPRWAGEGAAVAAAAQILTVPAVLYYFHVLPVYFLPANLFVTPLLEWTIIGGLAAALLAGPASPLSALLLLAADLLLQGALCLSAFLASLPGASLEAGSLTLPASFLYYGLLLVLLFYLWDRRDLAGKMAMLCLPALLVWNGWSLYRRPDVEFLVPDLGVSRGAVLAGRAGCIVYYREGGLPIDMGERELRSVLGYKGIFAVDILLLDLGRSRGPSPFTLTLPVREIWLDESSRKGAALFLAAHPESRVRFLADGVLRLRGGMTVRKKGQSWCLTSGGLSWYLDGGGPAMERPEGTLFWMGGAEPFRSAWNDDTMKVLAPDAAVYAGSGTPQSGEDRAYFELGRIPWVDPYLHGMVTIAGRESRWEMETCQGSVEERD